MQPMNFLTYPVLVHHRKWRTGEYLVTCTLFVTLLVEFLVEITSGLGPLDCDCSASEDDTALGVIEETAPFNAVQHRKFHGNVFHVVYEHRRRKRGPLRARAPPQNFAINKAVTFSFLENAPHSQGKNALESVVPPPSLRCFLRPCLRIGICSMYAKDESSR